MTVCMRNDYLQKFFNTEKQRMHGDHNVVISNLSIIFNYSFILLILTDKYYLLPVFAPPLCLCVKN